MELLKDILSFFRRTQIGTGLHGTLPEDINNPWPGLSPYNDPKNSIVKRKFCGREKETFELTRMIDENIFVTLYGKSGNGKTSLLNAGVFPYLRKMNYAPISIRLGMDSIGMNFQHCIIQAIENYFTKDRIEERWVIQPINDKSAVEYLWNYFARHRFYADNQHKTIVYPVIVFDQFEEIYRNRRQEADTLLSQINYLADKSHELEDCELDGELYTYEYNFRFLVSIREDDLYWLEDSIDNNMLYPMKETRYRLRSLSKKGAKDVIFIPGEGLFDESEKNKIANTIIDIANGNNGDISSNVLSLICSRIYIDYLRGGGSDYISYELVNNFISENPLEKFYLEATAHLTNSERAYLEDNLVDIAGRRSFVPQANFEQIFKKKGAVLLSGPQKILQENNERIELIHDSFCQVLSDQKTKRLDRWRTIVEYIAMMAMCILICYKQTLYHPFFMAFEVNSFLSEVNDYLLGCIETITVIFLFITIGLIRKSFPISFTWIAVAIIIYPLLSAYSVGFPITRIPFMHHVISLFLLIFTLFAHIYNLRNRPKDPKSRNTYVGLLDFRSLRFCLLVFLCFMIYYYVYKAPNGWYVGNTAFTLYLIFIPSLFYSVFDNEGNSGWVFVMAFLYPIALLIYYTSDTEFFSLSHAFTTSMFLPIITLIGCPIYFLWIFTDSFEKTSNRIIFIIIFLAFIFGLYALLYQYKYALLAIWCLLTYLFLYFVFRNDNKYQSLLCLATFIVTICVYTFSKGYNPTIKNVNISEQKGEWHWNTVMAKSDKDYRLYDGLTGRDLLGIGFDYQDDNQNLVKKLTHSINLNYEIVNTLYEVSGNDNTITYKCHPLFEQYISRESDNNNLAAIIFKQHRRWIFNDIINTKHRRPTDETRALINQLTTEERASLEKDLSTGNDSIIKHNVSQLLCKVLSSSWLYHATDSIGKIGDMWYFNYLCAFNHFTESHFFTQVYQQENTDWDGTFEELTTKYIECIDSIQTQSRDYTIEVVLPKLIEVYDNAKDYGLKTLLYGKIIRMQQLAILYGLGRNKWVRSTLTSPVGVDINKYYLEHRRR